MNLGRIIMKSEHLIIVIIGVLLFFYSYNLRASYFEVVFVWILGIVLVYLGLKMEEDNKKSMNK
jgi:uncharacterized protein YacL